MNIDKEKELIYQLMRSVFEEKRELDKQYLDLKKRLDDLDRNQLNTSHENETESLGAVQSRAEKGTRSSSQRKSKKEPIERIAGYVSEILREAAVPISTKEIYKQLINSYDINIQYTNFRNNILPRLEDLKQYSIKKAYRGYWQFRKGSF